MVMAALLASGLRRYSAVFFYTLTLTLTSITELIFSQSFGVRSTAFAVCWIIGESMRQLGLYAVVISFAVYAAEEGPQRRTVRDVLVALATVVWVGSAWVSRHDNVVYWATMSFRDIGFTLALVTLALWFVLIASPKRNATLLSLTGGLGLSMCGTAIGQSLRQLSARTVNLGDIILVVTHLLCLYIWWQTLRHEPPARRTSPPKAAAAPSLS